MVISILPERQFQRTAKIAAEVVFNVSCFFGSTPLSGIKRSISIELVGGAMKSIGSGFHVLDRHSSRASVLCVVV